MESKLPGRPRKPTELKVTKKNTAYSSENTKYIRGILEQRKWSEKGHWSRIVNELIKDHRQVKAFKDRQKAQARAALSKWE